MKQSFFVVTDSTADLRLMEKTRWNIKVVPLRVMFGDEMFLDGENLSSQAFYEKWSGSEWDPTTSPPTPQSFFDVYKSILTAHPEARILSIHLSAGLSTTQQCATLARSMLPKSDRVTILDTKSISFGLGNLVVRAAAMAQQGSSIEQCVLDLQRRIQRQKLYVLVDSLVHLQRGGRIGRASQLIGTLLNIKPVLMIDPSGSIVPFDKVRGRKAAILRAVDALIGDFGSNPLHLTILHAHAHDAADEIEDICRERLTIKDIETRWVSPVIGAHVGPGSCAILARWEDAN